MDPDLTTLQLNLTGTSLAALQTNAANGCNDHYFVFDLETGTSTGQFSTLTLLTGTDTYTDTITDGIATFEQLGLRFDLSYTANASTDSMTGGNDIAFDVTAPAVGSTPEPSTWSCLLLGFIVTAGHFRTSRKR